jgi:hypothetical protein
MTALVVSWVRDLPSRDLCALIGLTLIGLGVASAVLTQNRKMDLEINASTNCLCHLGYSASPNVVERKTR